MLAGSKKLAYLIPPLKAPKHWLVVLLGILLLLPFSAVISIALQHDSLGVFAHITEYLLLDYLRNTVFLLLGVGVFSLFLGVTCAWCVTRFQFPGRVVLEWVLILPLALPVYVLALVYGQVFDTAGIVQTSLRDVTGLSVHDYYFPEIRSLGGAIFVLTLGLYPYIYMLARSTFLMQSRYVYDSAKLLGARPWQVFWRVAVPVARPAIVAGLALVLMETLSDFGVVSLFGVPTFVTGLYRAWFDMYDLIAASKLALIILGFVLAVLYVEYRSRQRMRFVQETTNKAPVEPIVLGHKKGALMLLLMAIPGFLGFVLPLGILFVWGINSSIWLQPQTWNAAQNTLLLATITAVLTVMLAIFFAYYQRTSKKRSWTWLIQIATKGYAIPGAVIAIGVLAILTQLDQWLNTLLQAWRISPGLILSGSLVAVVFACLVRFIAPAFHVATSGYQQLPHSIDESAALLGASGKDVLKRVHLPLMRPVLIAAFLMVFIDVVKELPATLILRPFDFDTLAIRTYELSADEQIHAAAGPALLLVLFAVLPTLILLKRHTK